VTLNIIHSHTNTLFGSQFGGVGQEILDRILTSKGRLEKPLFYVLKKNLGALNGFLLD
jgi:hypothetical protein